MHKDVYRQTININKKKPSTYMKISHNMIETNRNPNKNLAGEAAIWSEEVVDLRNGRIEKRELR